MDKYSTRLNITMPVRLLRQLDALAGANYTSRSQVIKLALIDWIHADKRRAGLAGKAVGRPDPDRNKLKKLLTAEQLVVFKDYKRGEVTFQALMGTGLSSRTILELMDMGEI